MFHDDLEVKVSGPDKKYPHHLLYIASTGPYSLSVGNADTNCWIHRLELDNLRLIRDVIDNHLAKYLPKEDSEITITLEGGVIQEIEDIPEGVNVKVVDFDCDGMEGDDVMNVKGHPAHVFIWK